MKTILLRLLVLLLFVPVFEFPATAQNNTSDSSISGTLVDASGGAVSDVEVTATTEGQAGAPVVSTNSKVDGRYALAVPAGRYRVRFVRSPFVTLEQVVDLRPGESRTVNLRLSLERLSAKVVVTAEAEPSPVQQTPASVSVITREEIAQRQSVFLPEILLYTPGVAIGRTGPEGGATSIFLNGGNSNATKVLVDGTTVNEPGNAVDFSNFTLDNVDKIEVVRGAESALYGTDAVAGVIQVFTHRGETRVPSFGVFGEGGTFSTGRGGGDFSGLLGAFDYSAAAAYFSTEGQGLNDRFLNRTLSGNFGYRFSDSNQLRLSLRNNTSDAGNPTQTVFTPADTDQHSALHFFSANARWNFATGKRWAHQVSAAESYNREFIDNPGQEFFIPGPFSFCPQISPTAVPSIACDFPFSATNQYNRSSVSAQSSYLLPKLGATAGYQYEVENASLSALFGNHVRRNNQGGFLDFRYLPHPRVALNFGGRAEANQNFGTRVVPRVGASVALRQHNGFWGDTRYRIFYGQGIKEPRLDQSFGTDICNPGNASLKPEQSKTWSTGIEQKLANDRIKVSADYYSNRFTDIISFAFCFPGGPCPVTPPPGCPQGFGTFFNTDLARARGTNISVETRLLHWLMVVGNYSYDDSLVLASPNAFDPSQLPGNRLIRRPPNSGSLSAFANFHRLNVTMAGYFTGKRTDSDFLGLGLTSNPGYARFDLATSYRVARGFSLYARATNLFDKQYQDALGYPALGRDVRVGMNYRFGGRN
jgi:vitamin B12 transporter